MYLPRVQHVSSQPQECCTSIDSDYVAQYVKIANVQQLVPDSQ